MLYKQQLSKNFRLSKFVKSEMAEKKEIVNLPSDDEVINIKNLVENVMQPIRDFYGREITITSGYRCKELNDLVGGASNSDHTKGKACDFVVDGIDNYAVCMALKQLNEQGKIKFKQLILEPSWIHIAYDDMSDKQGECLTKDGNRYIRGICQ